MTNTLFDDILRIPMAQQSLHTILATHRHREHTIKRRRHRPRKRTHTKKMK